MTHSSDELQGAGLSKTTDDKRKYIAPDFEEEAVFETLAAGCTFNNPDNPLCENGKVQFS